MRVAGDAGFERRIFGTGILLCSIQQLSPIDGRGPVIPDEQFHVGPVLETMCSRLFRRGRGCEGVCVQRATFQTGVHF